MRSNVLSGQLSAEELEHEAGPDTLSDAGCESGVRPRAPVVGTPEFEWAERALDEGAEPGEITLVSIYDGTGLQHPEAPPSVEVR